MHSFLIIKIGGKSLQSGYYDFCTFCMLIHFGRDIFLTAIISIFVFIKFINFFLSGPNEDVVLQFFFANSFLRHISGDRVDLVFKFNQLALDLKENDYILSVRNHLLDSDDGLTFTSTLRENVKRLGSDESEYVVLTMNSSFLSYLVLCDNDNALLEVTVGLEKIHLNGTKIKLDSEMVRKAFHMIHYKSGNDYGYLSHALLLFASLKSARRTLIQRGRPTRSIPIQSKLLDHCHSHISEQCQLQEWYANVTKFFDRENLWIIEPKLLRLNFCSGNCLFLPFTTIEATSNAIFRGWKNPLPNSGGESFIPHPVCIPSTFKETWILFREGYDYSIEKLTDFVVASCMCA